jgi:hypothetical protein
MTEKPPFGIPAGPIEWDEAQNCPVRTCPVCGAQFRESYEDLVRDPNPYGTHYAREHQS